MATNEEAGGGPVQKEPGGAKAATQEELKKLRLSKESLKNLGDADLEAIVAGARAISEGYVCGGYWRVFTG